MKVVDLIDYLYTFGNDEEIEIEILEMATGRFLDSTAAVAISESEFAIAPILQIDVEAGKFKNFFKELPTGLGITRDLSPRKCPHPPVRNLVRNTQMTN